MASPQRTAEDSASTAHSSPEDSITREGDTPVDEALGFRRTEPDRRESLGKAFVQILVASAIFAGLFWMYYQHVQTQEEVRDLARKAQDEMMRNGVQDLHGAQRRFEEALALDDNHPYVLSALGLLHAELAVDYGVADAAAAAKRHVEAAAREDVNYDERFGAEGLLLVAEGKYAEAEKLLTDVVNRGGQGPAIFGALGLSQRGQGKVEDGRTNLRRGGEGAWRNPRYNAWVAQMYFDADDLHNTGSFVAKALESNPDHLPSLVLRSRLDLARNDVKTRTQETLDDVLGRPAEQLAPRLKAMALVARAEFARHAGEPAAAVTAADQAIELMPTLFEGHLVRGLALADQKVQGAAASLEKAFELYPYSVRAYHLGARALLAAGQTEAAKAVMDRWGNQLPKDSRYEVAYGNLLVESGDNEGAQAHYAKALELDEGAAEAWYRLGVMKKDAKDHAGAVDNFNKAVQIDEKYAEVYEAIGFLYLEQGHTEDGLAQLVEAMNLYGARRVDRATLESLSDKVKQELRKRRKVPYIQIWDNSIATVLR